MNILSIIIPVYNEEKTIGFVLDKIKQVNLIKDTKKDIIVINDASTDNTETIIFDFIRNNPDLSVKYFKHTNNLGKGAAIQTAVPIISGNYLIIQDADMEYDPEEYNLLLQPALDGFADVVYGSRFISGNPHRILFFKNRIGNQILVFFSNMFTNLNLSDVQTCYKLFKSEIVKKINLKEMRFGFEAEITSKIARIPNIRIYEVGISYYGRTYEEGKKLKFRDVIRIFYCLIKYNIFTK